MVRPKKAKGVNQMADQTQRRLIQVEGGLNEGRSGTERRSGQDRRRSEYQRARPLRVEESRRTVGSRRPVPATEEFVTPWQLEEPVP